MKKTRKSNKVIFANKSESLHSLFQDVVQKILGKTVHFYQRIDKRGVRVTEVNNKQLVEKLLIILPTWRRKPYEDGSYPPVRIPTFIRKTKKCVLRKVLQVMFSCDGSVVLGVKWHKTKNTWVFTRRIQITVAHPQLRENLREILEDLGFSPKIWRREIIINKKDELLKFKREIGFIDGVKVSRKSRYWAGRNKNEVLTLLIKSFELSAKMLKKCKSRDEVMKLLSSRS